MAPQDTSSIVQPDGAEMHCSKTEIANLFKETMHDAEGMKQCSEKMYLILSAIGQLRQNGISLNIDQNDIPQVGPSIGEMIRCLKLEGIWNQQIESICTQLIGYSNDNLWKNFNIELNNLKKRAEILQVNVPMLQRLVNESKKGAHRTKGKDIILLLGKTGAGKSTFIHYVCGSKMKLITNEDKMTYIAATDVKNEQLKKIIISPYSKSETLYISPVTMEFEDEDEMETTEVTIVDGPGQNDNRGVEIDIANQFGLQNSLKTCKTARLVVLINRLGTGGRLDGIKAYAYEFAKLMKNLDKNLKSVIFFFTRFSEEEQQDLHKEIESLAKEEIAKKGDRDEMFVKVIKQVAVQSKKGAKVVFPLTNKPQKFIDDMLKLKPIKFPANEFNYTIGDQSKQAVREYINSIKRRLHPAIANYNFEFVEQKLNEIKYLKEIADSAVLNEYNEVLQMIKDKFQKLFQHSEENFEKSFQGQVSHQDLQKFLETYNSVTPGDKIIQNYYESNKPPTSSSYQTVLTKNLNKIKDAISNSSLENENLQETLKNLSTIYNFLQITHLVDKETKDMVAHLFSQSKSTFNEKVQELTKKIIQSIKDLDFQTIHQDYQQLKQAQYTLTSIFESTAQGDGQLHEFFLVFMSQKTQNLRQLKDEEINSTEQIKKINQKISELIKIQDNSHLLPFVDKKYITEEIDGALDSFDAKFDRLQKETYEILNKNTDIGPDENNKLERLVMQMKQLQDVQGLEKKFLEKFISVKDHLENFIIEKKEQGQQSLTILDNVDMQKNLSMNLRIDYQKIKEYVLAMKQFKWIDNYKPGILVKVQDNVFSKVSNFLEELLEIIDTTLIDLDNDSEIQKLQPVVKQLKDMRKIEDFVEGLKSLLDRADKNYEKKFQLVLEQIGSNINFVSGFNAEEILDFDKYERCIKFFEKFKQNNTFQRHAKIKCKQQIKKKVNEEYDIFDEFELSTHTILDIVKDKLKNEYTFFCKECVESNLQIITSFKSKLNEDESFFTTTKLRKEAKLIYYRVTELQNIKNKFPAVQEIIGEELLAQIRTNIVRIQQELQFSIKQSIQMMEGNNDKFVQVYALTQVDSALELEPGFGQTLKEYQEKFVQQSDSVLEQLKQAIEQQNTQEIEEIMSRLGQLQNSQQGGQSFKQAKILFKTNVDTQITQLSDQLGAFYRYQEVTMLQVQHTLKKIRTLQAYQRIAITYYPKSYIEEIDGELKNAKSSLNKTLEKLMKYVIELNLRAEFQKADEIYSQQLSRMTQQFNDAHILDGETQKQSSQIDNAIIDILNEHINKYKDLSFNNYYLYPPKKLFENLSKCEGSTYSEAEKSLYTIITEKYRSEIKDCLNIVDQDKFEEKIELLLQTTKLLPEILQNNLELHLKQVGNQYKDQRNKQDQRLISYLNGKLYSKLKDLYNDESMKEKIQNATIEQCKELNKTLELEYRKEEIDQFEFSKKWEDLHNLYNEFSQDIPDIEEITRISLKQLVYLISNDLSQYEQNFLISNVGKLEKELEFEKDQSNKYEKLKLIIDILLIKKHQDAQPIDGNQKVMKKTINFHLQDAEKKLITVLQRLFESIEECKKVYQQTFVKKELNGAKIKQLIVFISCNQGVFRELLQIVNEPSLKIKSKEELKENIEHFDSFQIQKEIKQMCHEVSSKYKNYSLLNEETKGNPPFQKLEDHFKDVNQGLQEIQEFKVVERYIKEDLSATFEVIEKRFQSQLSEIEEDSNRKILDPKFDDLQKVQNNLYLVKAIKKNIPQFEKKCIEVKINTNKTYQEKVNFISKSLQEEKNNPKAIADKLIELSYYRQGVQTFGEIAKAASNEYLNKIKKESVDPLQLIFEIGNFLNENEEGKHVLEEYSQLSSYLTVLKNEQIARLDDSYFFKNISGTYLDKQDNKASLEERFMAYKSLYWDIINKFAPKIRNAIGEATQKKQQFKLKDFCKELLASILLKQRMLQIEDDGTLGWSSDIADDFHMILAEIMAYFSITRSEAYFQPMNLQIKQEMFLWKPHQGQILALLRMFCVANPDNDKIENNLIELGTGEGKSVILAAAACIFALYGCEVDIACYSQYLSQRDQKEFIEFFSDLGIEDRIRYGTFNDLCENLIKRDFNYREEIIKVVEGKSTLQNIQYNKDIRPKVVLFDEFDTFFSEGFYGKSFHTGFKIRGPEVKNMIMRIKDNDIKQLKAARETEEYKQLSEKYQDWTFLMDEAINDVITDFDGQVQEDYRIINDKIQYKCQDRYVDNITYGYKTLKSYFDEFGKGNISQSSLDDNIFFSFRCGELNFTDIPKLYNTIIGVSGTIKTLTEQQKKLISDSYSLNIFTFMPSCYGKSQLEFYETQDVKVFDEIEYMSKLRQQINERRNAKKGDIKRPVLVFFENLKKLEQAFNHEKMGDIQHEIQKLTEEFSNNQRDSIIKRATKQGIITFATSSFGRGTDFVCRDKKIWLSGGGVHVLLTFLPEDMSEFVQLKGRTARQGQNGSFSMYLLFNDLEKFLIRDPKDIDDNKDHLYKFLESKRQQFFSDQQNDNASKVRIDSEKHKNTLNFIAKLKDANEAHVKEYLKSLNIGTVLSPQVTRTILALDATCSMSSLLRKAKNTIKKMFQKASIVLEKEQIDKNCMEIQIVCYRNYDSSPDEILEISQWETKVEELDKFLDTIHVSGGWGAEAIEIALTHANEQHELKPIHQVFIIGDAPPNEKEDVLFKRERSGNKEDYDNHPKYGVPTYYKEQIQKLKQSEIPVHCLYIENFARRHFQEMAQETNGKCEHLDIHSSRGEDLLTDMITIEILRNVGDQRQAGYGDKLVKAYIALNL